MLGIHIFIRDIRDKDRVIVGKGNGLSHIAVEIVEVDTVDEAEGGNDHSFFFIDYEIGCECFSSNIIDYRHFDYGVGGALCKVRLFCLQNKIPGICRD